MCSGFFSGSIGCFVSFDPLVGRYPLELDSHAWVFSFDYADCVMESVEEVMAW